jgi:hypothetical protein
MADFYINVFLDDEKTKKLKMRVWPTRLPK